MKSVYGFDCYEAGNNAVDDIDASKEALLDSAYALTPEEEREYSGSARNSASVPKGAYAGGVSPLFNITAGS
jgi:hypothetical protein